MRADDRSLTPAERERVEKYALGLLHKADAWRRIPAPIDDLVAAANLRVAPYSVFDPRAIAAYAAIKGAQAAKTIKSAIGKLFGILDASEEVIHIDDSVTQGRQTFLKLHETGHFEIPHQRKMFRFFEDSPDELDPDISDLFEREANNFASYVMFNGSTFQERAGDYQLCFGSVKTLQRSFKVSLYASLREYTRTHHLPCIGICFERPTFCPKSGFSAEVRRIEASPSFDAQFSRPTAKFVTASHPLGNLIPIGSKVTRPTTFLLHDRNGDPQEFIGEALDTTFHILVFACPTAAFRA